MRLANLEAGKDSGASATSNTAAIRSQLASILESAHFRNSKRSQALLRFVVSELLEGHQDLLKERTIGVTVFGREPDYDTTQDAIVRNAAVEVRKRLAQYYMEPEHTGELRIEIPLGTYIPGIVEDVPTPAPLPGPRVRGKARWIVLAAGLTVAAAVTLWTMERRTAASELDAFWTPLFRQGEVIRVCVGQPTRLYRFVGPRHDDLDRLIQSSSRGAAEASPGESRLEIAPSELVWSASDFLYMRDAFAAARISAWIQSRGHQFQLMSVSRTTYSQLRGSPLVAVGAFDNPWALRVTSDLRFVFGNKTINGAIYHSVIDRRNPNATDWMVARDVGTSTTQDYAIVTRVLDPTTERTVVSVAGIENYGTLAAGEFVTGADYLGATLVSAPKDWRRKNVQIVLGTKIIEGTPGPPKVLATYYW